MITGYDHWGYPVYATESEEAWHIVSHDWDYHERQMSQRGLWYQDLCESWVHGYDEIDCAEALVDFDHSSIESQQPDSYYFKPARDIRAEKTRDYRKKRPKAQRYSSHIVPSLSALVCLLGGQS